MNVLVIEHELPKVEKIKDLLLRIDDSIRIVGVTNNMLSAAEWLSRNKIPDIILANKNMLEDVELKNQREIKALVTFSTTTEEYKFQAFRYKTIRHILNEMSMTEDRLVDLDEYPDEILKPVSAGSFKERFLVKQGQKLLSVPVSQIAYFFSQERFIFFKTTDNQKFLLEYRIEQLESLLSPDRFFRINRSFIISLVSVREIHAYFGNRLKLYLSPDAGKEVIVSRKRVSDFKEWLGK
ncbi:MAG: response regulator transcription factor [Chitinophagaceae bacterium]|nr:response regulator transcription factor [Chitinophagaceae bacterium]